MDLTITVEDLEIPATWTDDAPRTREAIEAALPVGGEASRWGDELYVSIGVDVPPENATTSIAVGDLAYWPQGNALCLFWGPTPASEGDQPRPASPVSVIGRALEVSPLQDIEGDATLRLSQG